MKRQEVKKEENEKLKPTTTTKKAKKSTTTAEKVVATEEVKMVDGEEVKVVASEEVKVVAGEEVVAPAGFNLAESCCLEENWPCYCLFCAAVEQISWGSSWLSTAEMMAGVEHHRSAFSSCDDVVWDDCIWDLKEFTDEDFNSPPC